MPASSAQKHLTRRLAVLAFAALTFGAVPLAFSADTRCQTPGVEEFHYSWHLRGALSWLAGIRFPTSGVGHMKNTMTGSAHQIDSELRIEPSNGERGFYLYQSKFDDRSTRTLRTFHGYSYDAWHRNETTSFDYQKRLARMRKETSDLVEDRVKKIPEGDLRDVLTGIYYLRQNAETIHQPVRSQIYSDGKIYEVMFRPLPSQTMTFQGQKYAVFGYVITAAPGNEKKWPGDIRVWLTNDARRIPLRIEMQKNFASLRLDLQSASGCPLSEM